MGYISLHQQSPLGSYERTDDTQTQQFDEAVQSNVEPWGKGVDWKGIALVAGAIGLLWWMTSPRMRRNARILEHGPVRTVGKVKFYDPKNAIPNDLLIAEMPETLVDPFVSDALKNVSGGDFRIVDDNEFTYLDGKKTKLVKVYADPSLIEQTKYWGFGESWSTFDKDPAMAQREVQRYTETAQILIERIRRSLERIAEHER